MPTLTQGTRLGPYEILDAIGAGGMGEVYRARDTRLDRIVAIKVLIGGLASDPQSRERFEREAKAVAALNHRNICVLHDIGEADLPASTPNASGADRVQFLVLEYLEGETLSDARRGPLPRQPDRTGILRSNHRRRQLAGGGRAVRLFERHGGPGALG